MVEIERVSSQSLDIEEVNKEKLKSVFPECFAEGKLDIDKLLNLCGEYIDNDFEKYKFEWKGKSECYKIAGKRSTGTLRPCKEESVNFDTTNNLYIEGDNLEVLKLLQTAYYRKVKMIYIDPPYNTGNDFVYEDDFKDPIAKYKEVTQQTTKSNPETMGRYHTNWLNMMYPRLRLASNLLRDDGVIFISIDDNEVTNLKKLCDEVFGEENFVAQITREAIKGGSQSKYIRVTHDYLLIYTKSISRVEFGGIEVEGISLNLKDEKGAYAKGRELNKWGAGSRREDSPSMWFPIKGPNGEDVYPIRNDGSEGRWRLGKEKMYKIVSEGDVIFEKRQNGTYIVYEKIRDDSSRLKQFISIFKDNYINAKGTEDIKKLFNIERSYFDYAKPINFIIDIMKMSAIQANDIILDFFSGSATTAHAVMQLNAEDGGNRKFICVQLPELCDEKSEAYKAGYKNICEIGKERIRRAGKKIAEQNSSVDVGFKVFKLDSSNLIKWDSTPTEDVEELQKRLALLNETIKPERNELDVVYEAMLKLGMKLDIPVKDVNINDKKAYLIEDNNAYTLICLDYGSDGINADDMKTMCEEYKPTRIVASEQAFKDDIALSNAHYILKDHNIEMKLL